MELGKVLKDHSLATPVAGPGGVKVPE
jgi:hypothetical protein